jgi:outer membrane protein OmpA-like peptidoglycan-associated protein
MKTVIAVPLLMASAAFAQNQAPAQGNQPPQQLQNQQQAEPPVQAPPQPKIARTNLVEKFNGPTLAEIYCSGFITKKAIQASGRVVAGYMAPEQAGYGNLEYIYLTGDLQEGQVYQLLRRTQDPNRYESYPGQLKTLDRLGELYQDLGRAKVLYIRKRVAVAHIESSCSTTLPGDIAVPFQERPRPEFKHTDFEQFAPPNGRTHGRVVMGRDLDTIIGVHRVVYLNVGDAQGVKPGDYFRVTREYSSIMEDPALSLPFHAPMYDDTQKDPSRFNFQKQAGELPRRSIGELMVISTSADSSTALTTYAPEEVRLGDGIEMIDATPIVAPAAANAAAPQPPTISCSTSRSSIQVGETSNIVCNGTAEEGHELAYSYQASSGQIAPHNNRATLTGTAPGPVTVTATAVDDRNLSAQTTVNVNVEAPAAPPVATTINELIFSPNSARVDNRAKAILDDDALRLQRDANANLILEGSTNPSEADTLAAQRANNARDYLTRSKGIDANRIQTRPAQTKTGAKVSVILMPAGAPQQ